MWDVCFYGTRLGGRLSEPFCRKKWISLEHGAIINNSNSRYPPSSSLRSGVVSGQKSRIMQGLVSFETKGSVLEMTDCRKDFAIKMEFWIMSFTARLGHYSL